MTGPPSANLVGRWPMVGRHDLVEQIVDRLDDRGFDGVLVSGPAGVGKTRLADEVRLRAEQSGMRCGRVSASGVSASVPLAAIAHLLPARDDDAGEGDDPRELLRRTSASFAESAGRSGRVLLMIDDVDLLDATSLLLVTQLVAAGVAVVVATQRNEAGSGPPAFVGGDRWSRIELDPLGRRSCDTLLHLVLGGPVDGALSAELWSMIAGNPLFLREVVLDALDEGVIANVEGIWLRTGPLRRSGPLSEAIDQRLGRLDPEAIALLRRLALCGPIGLAELERSTPFEVLDSLETTGVVSVMTDRRRVTMAVAHPLQREVLRAAVSTVATRRALAARAAEVEAHGARRREDALDVARWRLDAGSPADPIVVRRAARQARFAGDYETVRRLAEADYSDAPSVDAGFLLGEALHDLGRFDDAEAAYARTLTLSAPEELTVRLALSRSSNLQWGCGDVDGAIACLDPEHADGPSGRAQLAAGRALVLAHSGRTAQAVDVLASIPTIDDAGARLSRAFAAAVVGTQSGRADDALATARAAYDEHVLLGDSLIFTRSGTHLFAQVLALTELGRFSEASELASIVYDALVREQAGGVPRVWISLCLGRVALFRGRLAQAGRWLRETAAVAGSFGFATIQRVALNGVVVVCAQSGAIDEARDTQRRVEELFGVERQRSFLGPELALGPAWLAVAERRTHDARELLETGAVEAAATGQHLCSAWLLHDLARIGPASAVADRLAVLAEDYQGELVAVRAAHAAALVADDPRMLGNVSVRFERLDGLLWASEAALAASEAFARAGDRRAAAASAQRSGELAARCEGALTPGLATVETVIPLSSREREIAVLAAAGLPSKLIGERLFVSVKTVNNHLQSVYGKLGVSTRAELAEALRGHR